MTQQINYKGTAIVVRCGAWQDVMNSCFYREVDHIEGYRICVDLDGITFALESYD